MELLLVALHRSNAFIRIRELPVNLIEVLVVSHFWLERGCHLLLGELCPVYSLEERVLFNLLNSVRSKSFHGVFFYEGSDKRSCMSFKMGGHSDFTLSN